MRAFKFLPTVLFAAFAVLAGLAVAVVAAVISAAVFLRGRGRDPAMANRSAHRPAPPRSRPDRTPSSEVIDVIATEVPVETAGR